MTIGNKRLPWLFIIICLVSTATLAQGMGARKDVFRGVLFPPKMILEHQHELGLTEEQIASMKKTVMDVKGDIAEYEWDIRQAYVQVRSDLDASPIDEETILKTVQSALQAENQIKQLHVSMLIRLRNLLTDEQVEFLRQQTPRQRTHPKPEHPGAMGMRH